MRSYVRPASAHKPYRCARGVRVLLRVTPQTVLRLPLPSSSKLKSNVGHTRPRAYQNVTATRDRPIAVLQEERQTVSCVSRGGRPDLSIGPREVTCRVLAFDDHPYLGVLLAILVRALAGGGENV